jgi:hypothetical protein
MGWLMNIFGQRLKIKFECVHITTKNLQEK